MTDLKKYLQKNPKKVLIFDFDKTLFEIQISWDGLFNGVHEDLMALDEKIYLKCQKDKCSFNILQNQYVTRFGDEILHKIIKNNEEFELKNHKGFEKNDELVNFIESEKNYKYFVWSANTTPLINLAFKKYDLADKFEKLITRNNVRLQKPDPEGFKLIYDKAYKKSDYLFLGDSWTDEGASEAAGIDFLHVDYFD